MDTRKLFLCTAAVLAVNIMVSCGGSRTAGDATENDSVAMLTDDLLEQLDTLAILYTETFGNGFPTFLIDGSTKLSEEQKMMKPTCLMDPADIADLATREQKMRAMGVLFIDRNVARLYDMPTEEYDRSLKSLALECNVTPIMPKEIEESDDPAQALTEYSLKLYNEMKEDGTPELYWMLADAATMEVVNVLAKNEDAFMPYMHQENIDALSNRLLVLAMTMEQLSELHPEVRVMPEEFYGVFSTLEEIKLYLEMARGNELDIQKTILLK